MAAELRWILSALSAVLLGGIWWWGVRRSRQAPGQAELREPMGSAVSSGRIAADPVETIASGITSAPVTRDWGVSPFEPLSIRTADFEEVPAEAQRVQPPMTAYAGPVEESEAAPSPAVSAADAPAAVAAVTPPAVSPPAVTPPAVAAAARQRIVAVRVCAVGESRWPGQELLAAFDRHGLTYGRHRVFHRSHGDGQTLFCAASLIEPGTFDPAVMHREEYRGLSLFAVLPGPLDPVKMLGVLIQTAGELAETLQGTVQDSTGAPLSQRRAEALIDEVLQFQASSDP